MSIWSDIEDRSTGEAIRKEDEKFVNMDYASLYPRLILSDTGLKNTQITLSELTKELNKLRWELREMKQKQNQCKFKTL